MLSVSIFVFAYNEAENLPLVMEELKGVVAGLKRPYEIVIIDDGSNDGTGELSEMLAKEMSNTRVIHHGVNRGLGSVYMTAFKDARCDILTFYPADGQFSLSMLERFLALIDNHDMLLGFLLNRNDAILSRILSRVEKLLFRVLLGPMPKFQGLLMFRRNLLSEIKLISSGGRAWTVLMELIIRTYRSGYRVKSIEIELSKRLSGSSKVNNIRTMWANFKNLLLLSRYLRYAEGVK